MDLKPMLFLIKSFFIAAIYVSVIFLKFSLISLLRQDNIDGSVLYNYMLHY